MLFHTLHSKQECCKVPTCGLIKQTKTYESDRTDVWPDEQTDGRQLDRDIQLSEM